MTCNSRDTQLQLIHPYYVFVTSQKPCSAYPHACSRAFSQTVYSCISYAKSFFYSENLKEIPTLFSFYFFYLGFVSRTLKNHRTAREGIGHSINSSLPLPPASQKLRHQPRDYCRELISAHSQQPDHIFTPRFDFHVLTPLITVTKPYVFQCVF